MNRGDPRWFEAFYEEAPCLPPQPPVDDQAERCRALWMAVLHGALRDSMSDGYRAGARAWFGSAEIVPCSFRWICVVLDLDADAVLERLRKTWRKRDARR